MLLSLRAINISICNKSMFDLQQILFRSNLRHFKNVLGSVARECRRLFSNFRDGVAFELAWQRLRHLNFICKRCIVISEQIEHILLHCCVNPLLFSTKTSLDEFISVGVHDFCEIGALLEFSFF